MQENRSRHCGQPDCMPKPNRASPFGHGALNDVTEASFHYWHKRFIPSTPPATQLIALPFAASGSGPILELETPHGYVIRLGSQTQVGWLAAVAAVLR